MLRMSVVLTAAVAAAVIGLSAGGDAASRINLLSMEEKRAIIGGEECIGSDTPGRCISPDHALCTDQACAYDTENPPEDIPLCSREVEKKTNAGGYSRVIGASAGNCKVNDLSPINCTVEYYCNVRCESDEFELAWTCYSTNILAGYGDSRTPKAPGGDACPGCPLPPIALINGLTW